MNGDLRVAGAKLNSQEQDKLSKLATRINGTRSDVFKAFINYFTEDELAERVADVLRNPKSMAGARNN